MNQSTQTRPKPRTAQRTAPRTAPMDRDLPCRPSGRRQPALRGLREEPEDAARVHEEDARAARDPPRLDLAEEAVERLPGVRRVEELGLDLGHGADRRELVG